ncbi:MAG: DUF4826 family protein [Gammaproteobacteria bacterium]|nr:DUF4826 family protein [Gammaproteobacteria bacterium]
MTSTTEMARLMDTIAELTRERGDALRELERERASRPTPGLWLVEGRTTGWSGRWIAAGDVPDPLPVAALERHRDAMQRAVAASLDAGWRSDGQGANIGFCRAWLPSSARSSRRWRQRWSTGHE